LANGATVAQLFVALDAALMTAPVDCCKIASNHEAG
jgi:hypothetical protein